MSDVREVSALVTGASRGIGRAIALRLAAEGYDLTISGRDHGALQSLENDLAEFDVMSQVVPCDMTEAQQIEALYSAHLERFDGPDVLILSAGMGIQGAVDGLNLKTLDRQYSVNVRSAFQLAGHLMQSMKRSASLRPAIGAKVIVIASITGVTPEPGLAAYSATKSALMSMCESINIEGSLDGVSATSICPGYVDTDMSEWIRERISPEQMITTADVAELAIALTRLSSNAVVPQIVMTRPGSHLWRA